MYIDLLSNVNRKFDDPPNIRPSAPPNKLATAHISKGDYYTQKLQTVRWPRKTIRCVVTEIQREPQQHFICCLTTLARRHDIISVRHAEFRCSSCTCNFSVTRSNFDVTSRISMRHNRIVFLGHRTTMQNVTKTRHCCYLKQIMRSLWL